MKITITAVVPDEWHDATMPSGILHGPWEDIQDALRGVGAEDIDIQAATDWRRFAGDLLSGDAERLKKHLPEM